MDDIQCKTLHAIQSTENRYIITEIKQTRVGNTEEGKDVS